MRKRKKSFINKIPKTYGTLKKNFKLASLTWFKVGGNAEVFFVPKDLNDLINFLKKIDKYVPIKILGAGSNTLVRDGGVSGVVIKLSKSFCETFYIDNKRISVGAALNCIKFSRNISKKGYKNFEFFSGIPGTIGGAITMNAGAYGHQTSDCLENITTLSRTGKIEIYQKKDIKMRYRKTSLKKDKIIIKATFNCEKGNIQDITNKLKLFNTERIKTQPIQLKTSGSTFKNPSKLKAWRLIKDSGCANLEKGGAKVSLLHSNFIINQGIASAADVEDLGNIIRERVQNKFGIRLNWEIKIIGSRSNHRKCFYDN